MAKDEKEIKVTQEEYNGRLIVVEETGRVVVATKTGLYCGEFGEGDADKGIVLAKAFIDGERE